MHLTSLMTRILSICRHLMKSRSWRWWIALLMTSKCSSEQVGPSRRLYKTTIYACEVTCNGGREDKWKVSQSKGHGFETHTVHFFHLFLHTIFFLFLFSSPIIIQKKYSFPNLKLPIAIENSIVNYDGISCKIR